MAKTKQEKNLYGRLRASGVRKKVAKSLTELPTHANAGRKAPKPMREAVERLEATVDTLRQHVSRGDRKAAGRKAARTRGAKANRRKAAARRGAKKRA
jgi:hypothetical protein